MVLVACGGAPHRGDQKDAAENSRSKAAIDAKIEYQGKPRYLKVSKIQKTTSPLLAVFVEFENLDSDDRQGQYRTIWLDANGLPVWEQETWKSLLLHGNQKEMVKLVAPTNKAQDFKIQFNAVDTVSYTHLTLPTTPYV
jgi:uncharacterized protein YcfL